MPARNSCRYGAARTWSSTSTAPSRAPSSLGVDHATLLLGEGDAEAHLAQGRIVFLGVIEERPHFAVDLSGVEAPLDRLASPALAASGIPAESARFADLRQLAGRLERGTRARCSPLPARCCSGTSATAFAASAAARPLTEEAGHMRRCTNPDCKAMHFPRTDPAVIMLVSDGERALLGRNKNFPPGMYSTLAGFVEPGESLEDAVAREVREETAIEVGVGDLPLVAALAVSRPTSCSASMPRRRRARSPSITASSKTPDGSSATGCLSHVDDNTFRLPRLDSIARRLVEDWLHRRAGPGSA